MVTGIPYDTFWSLHPKPCSLHTVLSLLALSGYVGIPQIDPVSALDANIAIASVPSLNVRGGMHHVVFENREWDVVVHDPNRERGDVDWYGAGGFELTTWSEVIRVYKNPYFHLESRL